MKTESLKSLPELTVRSRKIIWRVAEQARLGLEQAQRKCLIDDPSRIDSGGRCLNADLAKTVSIDYARAYFEAIAVQYLGLGRPYRRLGQLLTSGMRFVCSETNARWKHLSSDDRMRFKSLCLPAVRVALLDRRDQLLVQSLKPQKTEGRPRRRNFLETLSPQDPYYKLAWQYHHESLADSHALEAEVHAGRATFSDFINGCVHGFSQAAETLVAIRDKKSVNVRCRKLDKLAKQFIRKTTASIAKQSKRLGKRKAEAATSDFSRRVLEISARSKQEIHRIAAEDIAAQQQLRPLLDKPNVKKRALTLKTRRGQNILDRLAQNPRHRNIRRSLLKAWEVSHELVAEAHAGRSSLRTYIEGCIDTFARGAKIQLDLRDRASVSVKCDEIDTMAAIFVKRFKKSLVPYSEMLGEGNLAAAETEFSTRVGEIASRSKKKLMKAELRRDSAARGVVGHRGRSPKTVSSKPTTNSKESIADDFSTEARRNKAIASYKERWTEKLGKCSDASLARSARVHPADLCKWKKSMLPSGSGKKERIEDALRNDTRPIPPVRADPNP